MNKISKLPVVLVTPINLSNGKSSGIQYIDDSLLLEGNDRFEKIDFLFDSFNRIVGENSSILLYKEDVKRLADQLSDETTSSKEIFREIKHRIRANYRVLKLSLDPRTLQFNGTKTAFIIHNDI